MRGARPARSIASALSWISATHDALRRGGALWRRAARRLQPSRRATNVLKTCQLLSSSSEWSSCGSEPSSPSLTLMALSPGAPPGASSPLAGAGRSRSPFECPRCRGRFASRSSAPPGFSALARRVVWSITMSGTMPSAWIERPLGGVDDQPGLEEEIGHPHGLGEEAPGVVAQVEHEPLQAGRLLVERLQRPLEVVVGPLLELRQAHVAVAGLELLPLDALDLDDLARHGDVEDLGRVLALEGERDLRVLRPAHLLDRIDERHVLGELAVDLHDLVARLDTGPIGGRVLDRRHDGEQAVAVGDLDAEPAAARLGIDLELLVEIGCQVGAVRIEGGEHAVDRALDELLGLDVVDVVLLDD